MNLRLTLTIVFICSFAFATSSSAYAQSQPANSYMWTSLTAGLRQPAPNAYQIDDFLFSFFNQGASAITIRSKLSRTGSNTWADCGQTGTDFNYPSVINLPQYGTAAWNVVNFAVLANTTEFTGTLTVDTNGGPSFYAGPPTTYTAISANNKSTKCAAYYDAWESSSWTPTWYWDATAAIVLSPYANGWHNNNFWDKGWNTNFTITNNGTNAVTYDIYYSSANGSYTENNPSSCAGTPLTTHTQQLISGGGGTYSSDVNTLANPTSNWDIEEDGAMYVVIPYPYQSGTTPSSSIAAFGSGTASACGSGCSETGSTRGFPMVTSCY